MRTLLAAVPMIIGTLVVAKPAAAQAFALDLGGSVSAPVGAFGATLGDQEIGSATVGGSVSARVSVGVGNPASRWVAAVTAGFNPMHNPMTEAIIGEVDFGHYIRLGAHTGFGYESGLLDGLIGYAHITGGGTLFRGPVWSYTTDGYWAPPVSGVIDYGISAVASGTVEGGFVFRNGLGIGGVLQYVPEVVFVGVGTQEGRAVEHAFRTPASTIELGVFYRLR